MTMRMGSRKSVTQHAESVGVVDDQPGVETFRELQEFGQRREVAVHAEHGIGQDQLAFGLAGGEQAFQGVEVAVRIALVVGAGKLDRVDQRGVVELVREHGVAAPDQRHDDAQVGHVTGREQQRTGKAGERGEFFFKFLVRREMAADQMRGAAADTPFFRPGAGGFDQFGIVGQPEVVVAAEADQVAPVDAGQRAAGGFERAANALEALAFEVGQPVFEFVPDHGWSAASRAPATARPR